MSEYIEREALLKNVQTYSMEFGEYIGEDVRDVDAILADRVKDAPAADVAPVVHCENCQHIHILNTSEIYAICDKTNFVFQPFGVDTREFGCPYGERRESEAGK